MREPGFDDLADLWNQPDHADQEAFAELARRARRHGRLLAYSDLAMGVLIVGSTVLGMFMTPHPVTIGAALLLLVATSWLTWKRRRFRQMAATLNTNDRAAFLRSSIRNASANLRRVTLSLAFFPLLMAIAVLFKLSLNNGGHLEHPIVAIGIWASSPRGLFALTFMALMVGLMIRSRRRIKAELKRLEELRSAYEEEEKREEPIEERSYPR